MFGHKFWEEVKRTTPELFRLDVKIDGHTLHLSGFDMLNALIVHNNILNGNREKIAIFRPKGSLTEVYMLIMAGLAYYKDAAKRNDLLSENDFVVGSLVTYLGKIFRYTGTEVDDEDGTKRYILANEDENKTRSFLSAVEFAKVSKYSGTRTTPDKHDAKTKLPAIEKTVHELIGYEGQQVKLSDYRAMLVCPSQSNLIDILKDTTVNGQPFFSLFPSARFVSGEIQRVGGRDYKERSFVFYFASTLSGAEDLLRIDTEGRIKTVLGDVQKAVRSASLLSLIEAEYSIEDTYLLGNAVRSEIEATLRVMGYSIWTWQEEDFQEFFDRDPLVPQVNIPDKRPVYVKEHNDVVHLMASRKLAAVDLPYPAAFEKKNHVSLNQSVTQLAKIFRGNTAGEDFLRSAYGFLNKVFQSPIPVGIQDELDDHLNAIVMKAAAVGAQPGQATVLREFVESLKKTRQAFVSDRAKFNAIVNIASRGSTCVLVKRARYISSFERLFSATQQSGRHEIATDPGRVDPACTRLVWSFRPNLNQYADGYAIPTDSTFFLFPIQSDEMREIERQYKQIVSRHSGREARAAILKVNPSILDGGMPEIATEPTVINIKDVVGLEELLFAPGSFGRVTSEAMREAGNVDATLVTFAGGFVAYFEPDQIIKIIDIEGEVPSVEDKDVVSLRQGDKVVFIKHGRDTIFDELVQYYAHKPEVVSMVKLAETWRTALQNFSREKGFDIVLLRAALAAVGLERTEHTVRNWIEGKTICPSQNDYRPIDLIATLTQDPQLLKDKEKVKEAGRAVHSMRIKIGHYLARRILQSTVSQEHFDDPVLEQKLNTASSYAEIAEVASIGPETSIDQTLTNRLLGVEDF